MFDLTKHIKNHRRQKLAAAIKAGAKLIAECQDEQKRWLAMRELRKLQERLGYPSL